jgi:hypothetical protein
MDGYTSYILRISEARLSDLRREAAAHGLARAGHTAPATRPGGRVRSLPLPSIVRVLLPA